MVICLHMYVILLIVQASINVIDFEPISRLLGFIILIPITFFSIIQLLFIGMYQNIESYGLDVQLYYGNPNCYVLVLVKLMV